MKTALISLLAATLIGFASIASGRPFNAAAFISTAFSVGLAAWTIEQYSRKPRSLDYNRPVHLPIARTAVRTEEPAQRLAA